jgi:pilus assembly protein CpaE
MDAGRRVILLTNDPETLASVTAVLKSAKKPAALETCASLSNLVALLDNNAPGVALIDVDPDPRRILVELDPIIARFIQTRFVAISNEVTSDLMLDAMQIGVRLVLRKRSIEAELMSVLDRFVFGEAAGTRPQGMVVTVFSAGGGCGATTLALNLAHEIQMETSRPVLLADMDDRYGAIAAYLDKEGEYGIADVMARKQIDEELIRTTALTFSERLHVLLSPASVRASRHQPIEYESMNDFLNVCRRSYGCTVIDAPRLPHMVAARLAAASTRTFLLLQLSVKDIRTARTMLKSLAEQGVAPESITVVISRYHRRSIISMAQAREALGIETFAVLGSDFRHALESMTYGQPLAEVAPRSPLRKEIRELALGLLELPANPE